MVKHGIKMTGMPAWGVTHDEDLLWDVVAFVRKLPELTPEQFHSILRGQGPIRSEYLLVTLQRHRSVAQGFRFWAPRDV